MNLRSLLALTLSLLLVSQASGVFPTLYLKPVCQSQLHSPTNITAANDGSGRLFICEQQGKVMIFQGGMLRPTPFLDLTGSFVTLNGSPAGASYDERGLLGMAFHPGYATPASPGYRKFYVYYMKNSPNAPGTTSAPVNSMSVISEFQVSATDPNLAVLGTERVLMSFDQPQFNHNGGQLEFGPDGFLYIGFGDGGSSNDNNAGHTGGSNARPNGGLGNGQDRRVLFGKIIRIDPLGTNGPGGQYGIPASNPFVGQSQTLTSIQGVNYDGPMRGEIWSYGMRNPWRFSFDKRSGGTNRLFCGDVGQGQIEEINLIVSGGNYGWRYKEGTFIFAQAQTNGSNLGMVATGVSPASSIDPIAQYAHPGATGVGTTPQLGLSVTGGYVYRGSAIPALQGKYLFGDYGATSGSTTGRILGLEETSPSSGTFTLTQTVPILGGNPLNVRIQCMGEDENGELYFGTKITAGVLELSNGLPAGALYKVMPTTGAGSTALQASADNVLFQENGDGSNGTGPYLFAGNTSAGNNYAPRRTLLKFDVSALPGGAVPSSASLALVENKTIVGAIPFNLHKVTTAWGEGSSTSGDPGGVAGPAQIGDATWTFNNVTTASDPFAVIPIAADGTTWGTAGGDFAATASATTTVNSTGTYTWSSVSMISDVMSWLTTPTTNFGWLLKGPEAANTTEAKRFSSRENPTTSDRPKLTVSYAIPPAITQREIWLSTYFPAQPVGFFLDEEGDFDGDGISNLIEYAYAFNPTTKQSANDGLIATSSSNGIGTDHNITFRRDPRATDLTYALQTSTDLVTWTTIVTSTAGGTPTGTGYVSETTIAGESPIKLVAGQQVLTTPNHTRSFVRLRISRVP